MKKNIYFLSVISIFLIVFAMNVDVILAKDQQINNVQYTNYYSNFSNYINTGKSIITNSFDSKRLKNTNNDKLVTQEQKGTNQKIKRYENKVDGYVFYYNEGKYKIDESLKNVRVRFYNQNTEIEIYYDDFNNHISNASSYISYTNKFMRNTDYHYLIEDKTVQLNGYKTHILRWNRDKLSRIDNDKNYYLSTEIVKNNYEVYTIFIKSNEPIENEMEIINSLRITNREGKHEEPKFSYQINPNWNQETRNYYEEVFINSRSLLWGIFNSEKLNNLKHLSKLEEQLNYTFPVVLRYQMFGKDQFPREEMDKAYEEGRTVELTLQYAYNDKVIAYHILDGEYDNYLRQYAKDLKDFGHPILFRLNNEMNGDWVYYSSYHASKDTTLFIEMWKYIYNIFEEEGVNNLIWVWNPNHRSLPDFKWNHPLMYFPGEEYVNVIGLTAYNTGTYYSFETWNTFDELYTDYYEEYNGWFDYPMMITEFASSSIGGNKEAWVEDMFKQISKYPNIKIAIWWSFQDLDADGNPARIYFLNENEKLIEIFKRHLQNY